MKSTRICVAGYSNTDSFERYVNHADSTGLWHFRVNNQHRSYRWRAKREFGLSSVEDAYTGTVIQRFDSALRLMTGFHTDPSGGMGAALFCGAHWVIRRRGGLA